MYKVLKFGACLGVIASLAACGTSEHFMQDDVYNTRTPLMPPGTDLNDVTDYATFVAKKEQSETPERTAYVSPRQYNDYFYNSQYVYYGYSPYGTMTGLGYYGYNGYNGYYTSNYYHPMGYGYGYGSYFYPTIGFGGYYGGGYNPYSIYNNPYGYSYGYNHPYYGGDPWGGYYGSSYPYYSGNNTGWYTPKSKPNTPGNLSNAHAGTSAGRMGSSNSGIISYPNQISAKPNGFSGVGRNTNQTVNSSPVVNNGGRSERNIGSNPGAAARPVISGRSSTTSPERTGTYRAPNTNSNSNPGGTNQRTINNNTNTRPSSSPTIRSGGSSGGSISSPSGGGSRSGGRR